MKPQFILSSFIILLTLLFSTNAIAQQRGGEHGQGVQLSFLFSDDVNLSQDQKEAIAHLMVEHRQSMREMRAQGGRGARNQQRDERMESRLDLTAEIKSILTPTQLATLEANQRKRAESHLEMRTYMLKFQAVSISDEVGLNATKKAAVTQAVENHIKNTAGFSQNRDRGERPNLDSRIEHLEAQRAFRDELKAILDEKEFDTWMAEWSKLHAGFDGNRPQRGERGMNNRGHNRQRGQYR